MKKIISLILIIALSFSICACNTKKENVSPVEQYKTVAQQYIDKGDMETAKKALEEGISVTGDESLKKMLEELSADTSANEDNKPEEPTEDKSTSDDEDESKKIDNKEKNKPDNNATPIVDYTIYNGEWCAEGFSWEDGGFVLYISVESNTMTIDPNLVSSAPYNRIAEFSREVHLDSISDNLVTIPFLDSWGNFGKLTLKFNNNSIECKFFDTVSDSMANWGFGDATYLVHRKDL